jgi:hypothetical protein
VVVNNTKPVDQLILSSSLEAGGGLGTKAMVHTLFVGGAFGRGIFNSLFEVGGRPTIEYDNPHFRKLSTFISQNSCFLSTLRQARK